jgi:hypothetical protein
MAGKPVHDGMVFLDVIKALGDFNVRLQIREVILYPVGPENAQVLQLREAVGLQRTFKI